MCCFSIRDVGNQCQIQSSTGDLTTSTWDARNRLVHMEGASQTPVAHTYNGLGQRVEQQRPNETIRYLWDGENVLIETDEADATQATYTQTPGGYGKVISQKRGADARYYHFDALGSTDSLTDETEAVTDSYEYLAFGYNAADKDNTTKNPYQFVGQLGYQTYHIDNSDYPPLSVRERHYDPVTGRWLSQDPLGFAGGDVNLWRYAGNRPVSAVDPSGLIQWTAWDFLDHYLGLSGQAVNLADVGHYYTYWNAPDPARLVNDDWNVVLQSVPNQAHGVPCDEDKFTYVASFRDLTDVTEQLHAVGRSTFFIDVTCHVELGRCECDANCAINCVHAAYPKRSVHANCIFHFYIKDIYEDLFGIGVEFGVPYRLFTQKFARRTLDGNTCEFQSKWDYQ